MKRTLGRTTIVIITVALWATIVPLAASEKVDDRLLTESIQSVGGSKTEGGLSVFLQEQDVEFSVTGNPEFSMFAEQLIVETDRSDLSIALGRYLTDTDRVEYGQSTVEGLEHRSNYMLSIWPIDMVSVQGADSLCTISEPSTTTNIERPPLVVPRENDRADVRDSLQWMGCDQSTSLQFEGDFLLRLWEWDAELTHENGARLLESGKQNHEQAPGEIPDLSGFAGQAQEQYLFAYNATLVIPSLTGHYELYLQDPETTASSGFSMSSATGSILGVSLDQQKVFLGGERLTARTQGTGVGEPFEVGVNGEINRLEIDGQQVDIQRPVDNEAGAIPVPLFGWIALIATAGVLVLGTLAWHASPELRHGVTGTIAKKRRNLFNEAVSEAMDYSIDRPRRGRKWAKLAMRLKPNHPDALAAMGTVHFHRREYKKALKCFQRAIVNVESDFDPRRKPEQTVPFWAVYCARSLGGLRLETKDPAERDMLGEQVLWYARMAAEMDLVVARSLFKDGYISDLWGPIRMMIDMERHGVSR